MTRWRAAVVSTAALAGVLGVPGTASAAQPTVTTLQSAVAYLAGDGVLVDVGAYAGTGLQQVSAEAFVGDRECFTDAPSGLAVVFSPSGAHVDGSIVLPCADPRGGPDVLATVTVDLTWSGAGEQTTRSASPGLRCTTTTTEAVPVAVSGSVRVSVPAMGVDTVLHPDPEQLVRLASEVTRCAQPGRP